jgi:2-methylcitrate dehydratase
MRTLAAGLAQLVSAIRFEVLPEEVVRETKRRLLDTLGCALGGFHGEASAMVRDLVADLGGRPESTVIGASNETSCEKATLANATMLRFLDYMDSHAGSDPCHPCFNIPPCLAAAERVRASGRELIAAIVAGYEIQIRFQEACRVTPQGWFSGTYLEFSVPLAVGKLLGLNTDQMVNAVSIAATHANALNALSHGSIPSSKSIADAMVGSTGVMAALLAQKGLVGPAKIIEGPGGFEKAVAGRIDQERLLAPVAQYKMMEVNTKWFNTVRTGQTAVTGLLGLLQKHRLTWRDAETINIFLPSGEHVGHEGVWNSVSRLRPETRDSANHSIVFSVAAAMVDGELGPEQYADAKLHDPNLLSMVDRITLQSDPALDPYWPEAAVTRVAMKTKNGQTHEATTLYPPGHHRNRLPDQELQQKFRKLARRVLREKTTEAVVQGVNRLHELKSINELMIHLRGQG